MIVNDLIAMLAVETRRGTLLHYHMRFSFLQLFALGRVLAIWR